MKKYFVVALVALFALVMQAAGDTVSLSGTGSVSVMVGSSTGGYFYFSNNGSSNSGPYSNNVFVNNTGYTTVNLGSLSLPSGATLDSAVLSWSTTGANGTILVGANRVETDYQYFMYWGYGSYRCGLFSWCGYSYPVYGTGHGGTANIYAGNSYGAGTVTFGNLDSLGGMSGYSGSMDLVAMGWGDDLSTGPITFSAAGNSWMGAYVSDYGYYADTFYYPGMVFTTFTTTATLDVTYSMPAAPLAPAETPEPGSLALLGGGLGSLALIVRRKMR